MMPKEGDHQRRQQFYTKLLEVLRDDEDTHDATYAACEIIKPSDSPEKRFTLDSLHVEGAGDIHLPLSIQDTCKLRGVCEQAPFGQGLATVVDTTVRRCWQVDASQVTFPGAPEFMSKTIHQLARKAMRALGASEAFQVEAHFYKLLLYETGGHFKMHRDTEKEKGMFATLVLQLPTEEGFQGGVLKVKHKNLSKLFDCSQVSSTGFCYTVFFADCEHELKTISSGTRLCLAFNLIRSNTIAEEVQHPHGFISKVGEVEGALQPWLEAVMEGTFDTFGVKLAFPLEHKYTKENLSFAGLKGEDKSMAEVLKNCRDDDNEPLLDLHLCLAIKHEEGSPEPDYGYDDHYSPDNRWYGPAELSDDSENHSSDDGSDEERDHADYHTMGDVHEEDTEFTNWIGVDDEPSESFLEYLSIDIDNEVVVDEGEDVFDDEPDEKEYEGYTGNAGPTLEYWYHRAMLVVWPQNFLILVACEAGISKALDFLKDTVEIEDPSFLDNLEKILRFCEKKGSKVSDTLQLLKLFSSAGRLEDVFRVFKLLLQDFQRSSAIEGNFARTIAAVVQKFGWDSFSGLITELVKGSAIPQGELFAQLCKELLHKGNKEAAISVAKCTFEVLWTTNATISNLDVAALCKVVKTLLSLEEIHCEFGPKVVERLKEIKTEVLVPVVIQTLPKYASANWKLHLSGINPHVETSPSMPKEEALPSLDLFFQICQTLVIRDFRSLPPSKTANRYVQPLENQIVELVHFVFGLGNKLLFNRLIENIVSQARKHKQYHLLKKLLDSDLLWRELPRDPVGKSGLQALASSFLNEVCLLKEPVFTWCQPLAKFRDHPVVESFLRGPKERMIFQGLSGLPQARKLARNFNGTYRCGYSAIGREGGRGAGAFCEIQKTRHAFDVSNGPWKKEQEEMKALRTRLASLRSVNEDHGQHDKKRKIMEPIHISD